MFMSVDLPEPDGPMIGDELALVDPDAGVRERVDLDPAEVVRPVGVGEVDDRPAHRLAAREPAGGRLEAAGRRWKPPKPPSRPIAAAAARSSVVVRSAELPVTTVSPVGDAVGDLRESDAIRPTSTARVSTVPSVPSTRTV